MKTKAHVLLLLISISFFSCNNTVKNQVNSISNIDRDFPITEKLDFKPFGKYDILTEATFMMEDSILWLFNPAKTNILGACYNLNTGEKLSIIASKGRAANELTELEDFQITGDSVVLYGNHNTIKTFAKKDIINNVPMGERKFSVITVPDSLQVRRMIKLPNGSILATIMPDFTDYEKTSPFNKKSVAILNNKEANLYQTINYESFDIKKAKDMELPANDLIKCAYADGSVKIKDNDMAVFSVNDQFILYTFDLKSGNVVNEKRYTKMQREASRDKTFISLKTINDRRIKIETIQTNDNYILCSVRGYFSEEDKDLKQYKEAIFIFDWDLNPIKKFDLPNRKKGYYITSNDCSSVYFCEFTEDGLALHKAILNI